MTDSLILKNLRRIKSAVRSRLPHANYFPNQLPKVLSMEAKLREAVAGLPEGAKLERYEAFSHTLRSLTPTRFTMDSDMVIASQKGREIAFPFPLPKLKYGHIVFGYEEWLQRKYLLPDFVWVEPGDVVIDCGAYVGGFSLGAAKVASDVHAFEPDELNFKCLSRNVPEATVNQMGLFNTTAVMKLNISTSSVEHSLLMPDDGPPAAVREIQVITLEEYCRRNNIDRLDFVKIEAEGVELEVFEGLGNIRPKKLAIDVSPERDGESPADEFRNRLLKLGYEVRQRAHVLFARR